MTRYEEIGHEIRKNILCFLTISERFCRLSQVKLSRHADGNCETK